MVKRLIRLYLKAMLNIHVCFDMRLKYLNILCILCWIIFIYRLTLVPTIAFLLIITHYRGKEIFFGSWLLILYLNYILRYRSKISDSAKATWLNVVENKEKRTKLTPFQILEVSSHIWKFNDFSSSRQRKLKIWLCRKDWFGRRVFVNLI